MPSTLRFFDRDMGPNRDGATPLRRVETIGAVAVIVCGVILHFVYEWSGGSRLLGLFAPVNESVWEHLKLVLVPVTGWGVVEMAWVADRRRLWWAKLVEEVAACSFIVAFFYTYTGAFGVDSVVWVDVLSFVVAVVAGQWLSYRLITAAGPRRIPLRVSVTALALLTVAFGVLTFAPPHVPLFQDTTTGTYGACEQPAWQTGHRGRREGDVGAGAGAQAAFGSGWWMPKVLPSESR